MLKIGRIAFANCTPLFMALEEGGQGGELSMINGVPTELNHMLDAGGVDLSPSSSMAYLRAPEKLGFLPDLSIASIGPVGSVLLFSDLPLEKLDGERVALTPSSATSVVLLRVLLEGFGGIGPEYIADGSEASAELMIGDMALREAANKRRKYTFDLGSLWFEATGLPFVFGLWLVRRESFERAPGEVRAFYRKLVAARQRAYRNYPEYARRAPEARWMGEKNLLGYWGSISYDLTAWHMAGLRRFAEEAAAFGEIRRVPDLKAVLVEG